MEFPEQYIRKGRFQLHSGEVSDTFYDVNALLTDREYASKIMDRIPVARHYVGIATGGALIADRAAIKYNSSFSMIKDNEIIGRIPNDKNWVLIDDVVTSESSFREALNLIRRKPKKIFVVVDRRTETHRKLNLVSAFKV